MSLRDRGAAWFSHLMEEPSPAWYEKGALAILNGASQVYERAVLARCQSYQNGRRKAVRLPVPVISLGNITVGGTGKTPTACMLARQLQQAGYKPALLNRGYRSRQEHGLAIMSDEAGHILLSAEEGGDEAYLMALQLPGVPVIVGRDRAAAGQLAIERFNVDVILLDDAYQHWQLERDLDIVLVDATNPFGNGHVLPRGILREPLSQLGRAGMFLLTKADMKKPEERDEICRRLHQYNKAAPVVMAAHTPRWCIPFAQWLQPGKRQGNAAAAQEQPVFTVCALGNPAAFEATVREFGLTAAGTLRFDDHHQYTAEDISRMARQAQALGAVIVTTEKDAVKLPVEAVQRSAVPIYVLGIEIEILSGPDEWEKTIRRVVGG